MGGFADLFGDLFGCLPATMPIQQAAMHKVTLASTLTRALSDSPFSIKLSVSMEKVEKVVNAPNRPMSSAPRHSGSMSMRSINST